MEWVRNRTLRRVLILIFFLMVIHTLIYTNEIITLASCSTSFGDLFGELGSLSISYMRRLDIIGGFIISISLVLVVSIPIGVVFDPVDKYVLGKLISSKGAGSEYEGLSGFDIESLVYFLFLLIVGFGVFLISFMLVNRYIFPFITGHPYATPEYLSVYVNETREGYLNPQLFKCYNSLYPEDGLLSLSQMLSLTSSRLSNLVMSITQSSTSQESGLLKISSNIFVTLLAVLNTIAGIEGCLAFYERIKKRYSVRRK